MRQIVTADEVERRATAGQAAIVLEPGAIVTVSAWELAARLGVTIVPSGTGDMAMSPAGPAPFRFPDRSRDNVEALVRSVVAKVLSQLDLTPANPGAKDVGTPEPSPELRAGASATPLVGQNLPGAGAVGLAPDAVPTVQPPADPGPQRERVPSLSSVATTATRVPQILAIDAGGTMTDTFIIDAQGDFVVGKAQTTAEDESVGLINSARDALAYWELMPEAAFPGLLSGVYSGTSMLNRLLQRQGERVGLIVNKGNEDALRMGRARQTYLGYSYADRLHVNSHRFDPALVPRELIRGVSERVDMFGEVIIPLYENEVTEAVNDLVRLGVRAIVCCLLHSYRNPVHERRVRDIAEEIMARTGKQVPVFLSSDYYPIRMEVPRLNTVVVEAYAAEPSREQLENVARRLHEEGASFELRVMASHGGTISIKAKELARTLSSGPIGGMVGAKYLGERLRIANLVCTDIGGTSFDMGLITEGNFAINPKPDIARLLLVIPMVAMASVGAGTGSYVRIDPIFQRIQIGPDSAGSRIGVCYPEGGVDTVTVTDCHVVLGLINPEYFLGGEIRLDRDRAFQAVKEQVADPLGLEPYRAAFGVIEILEAQLKNHLEAIILEAGYSPATYTLLSYGGGGPVHTAGYTAGLGFEDILVPTWAAGFSAFGCGAADFEYRADKTMDVAIAAHAPVEDRIRAARELTSSWDDLEAYVVEEFEKSGFGRELVTFRRYFRMQYQGQLNDLEIESPLRDIVTPEDLDTAIAVFEDTYGLVYAMAARSPELGWAVTGVTVRGTTQVPRPHLPEEPLAGAEPPALARKGERQVSWAGEWRTASVLQMEELKAGNLLRGFTIVESPATTFVVPPGYEAFLDAHRIFHLKRT